MKGIFFFPTQWNIGKKLWKTAQGLSVYPPLSRIAFRGRGERIGWSQFDIGIEIAKEILYLKMGQREPRNASKQKNTTPSHLFKGEAPMQWLRMLLTGPFLSPSSLLVICMVAQLSQQSHG